VLLSVFLGGVSGVTAADRVSASLAGLGPLADRHSRGADGGRPGQPERFGRWASARNGLLLLGFLLVPIFPTLVGVLFREFKTDRGTLYGLMFAIGSMGSLLAAPLIACACATATLTRRCA